MEMRLSVTVDDRLLESAVQALNARSKAEAIRLALQEVVRRRRLEIALSHAGDIELAGTIDDLERLRGQE